MSTADPIDFRDIEFADWQSQLGDVGRAHPAPADALGAVVEDIADIAQALHIILTTPPGSDPLRPDFACDLLRYIDKPAHTVLPYIVRDVTAAVALWEPRVELLKVELPWVSDSHRVVRLSWRRKGDAVVQTTDVGLAR